MSLLSKVLLCVFAFGLFLKPGYSAGGSGNAHAPIVIQSDADFTACNCVVSGAGSTVNPFIIGPWTINNGTGNGVLIDGTNLTKSFVLMNLTVSGNGASTTNGIVLKNINPSGNQSIVAAVRGNQTSIQTANVGILVDSSSYVTLDGGGANPNGAGIGTTGAGTINKHSSGSVDIENSSHIVVTGWQMSASGGSIQPDWITLDPTTATWGVGGVRFFGVSYSTIDHNALNNCTSVSISLFNSSHNTVSNNTADYPFTMNFLVADGSSYNSVIKNVASTGDFFGYVVADPLPRTWTLRLFGPSHDNQFIGNISHTDGPTGTEIHGGQTPAFLGGFVVLNGTFNNTISNNQDWASTGAGFAWAQVVPANTPIGVATFPPPVNCNVTASEGGGGVSDLNGNIWTGNTFQTIAPCLPPQ